MVQIRFQAASRDIGYTVRDITTASSDLVCWQEGCDEEDLLQISKKDGYTYIPALQDGLIRGVIKINDLKQGTPHFEPLTSKWLIAADTPILHLLELFAAEPERHLFVLSSSQIIGLVTPADLNKIPARASFYLLIAHFETELTKLITKAVGSSEMELSKYLTEGRIERAKQTQKEERDEDIELPLIHYVQLFDLVEVVAGHDELRTKLGFDDKKAVRDTIKFADIRNPIAHLNNLLIKSRKDILEVNEDCCNIIKYSQRITQLISQ